MAVIYALALLWLALTGGFNAWQNPTLLAINGALSAAAVVVWLWRLVKNRGQVNALTGGLLAYWLYLAGLLLAGGASLPGLTRLYYYLALIAVSQLPVSGDALRRGARLAGLVYFPLSFLGAENANTTAMNLWALYWLAGNGGRGFLALFLAALLHTGSEGGWLAGGAGLLAAAWQTWPGARRALAGASLAGALALLAGKLGNYGSFWARTDVFGAAWAGFGAAPWGHGPNSFFAVAGNGWATWDQHNIILTAAWEGGVIGLAWLGWLGRRLKSLSSPAWPLSAAFAVHSMIDGPYLNFLAAISLMLVLGGVYAGKESRSVSHCRAPGPEPVGRPGIFARLGGSLGRAGSGEPGP